MDYLGSYELGELEFKYIGNMYGNEVVSWEIFLYFIENLLKKYNKDDEIIWFVDLIRIYIMLFMNFDGYEKVKNDKSDERKKCIGLIGRVNVDGVDLNWWVLKVFCINIEKIIVLI